MQKRNSYLVSRAFKNYLGASVLTVAATQVANIADASIVGNLIGPEALAAVNLSKPVVQTIFAISTLYVASTSLMAGIAMGRGDRAQANKLFTVSMVVSVLVAVLFIIGGLIWLTPLSRLLCQSDKLRPMTNAFMLVAIVSALPQLLMHTLHEYVTVDGSPRLITRAVIVGNVFNIVCDIVFIKYCGWGISGAAWATFIMYVVCILMVLPHFRKQGTLRLSMPRRGDIDYAQATTYGVPLFLSTSLLSVQFAGNNYVAARYLGDGALIALAVCMQLFAFSMIVITGTLRTVQPVGAILKGMGDNRGMLFMIKRAYLFVVVCLGAYGIGIALLPTEICQLLGAANGQSMPIILDALPPFTLYIVVQGLLYNLIPVYQFYGHKNLALILSIGLTLLPMFGFWALRGRWTGFFVGQVVVAVAIVVCTAAIRKRDRRLVPIFLIPGGDDNEVYDVTMKTTIESLGECRADILAFLLSEGVPKDVANRHVVCAEELIKNIIVHGHANSIDIRATRNAISIHDDGKPFNPLHYHANDSDDIDGDGTIGLKIVNGIGINMKYDYRFNQNMITINI